MCTKITISFYLNSQWTDEPEYICNIVCVSRSLQWWTFQHAQRRVGNISQTICYILHTYMYMFFTNIWAPRHAPPVAITVASSSSVPTRRCNRHDIPILRRFAVHALPRALYLPSGGRVYDCGHDLVATCGLVFGPRQSSLNRNRRVSTVLPFHSTQIAYRINNRHICNLLCLIFQCRDENKVCFFCCCFFFWRFLFPTSRASVNLHFKSGSFSFQCRICKFTYPDVSSNRTVSRHRNTMGYHVLWSGKFSQKDLPPGSSIQLQLLEIPFGGIRHLQL